MKTKMAALVAVAMMLGLGTAHAAGKSLTFGGDEPCTVLNNGNEGLKEAAFDAGWMDGYWSALNAMQATDAEAWVGFKLGPVVMTWNIEVECKVHPYWTLQEAVNSAYNRAQAAGQ